MSDVISEFSGVFPAVGDHDIHALSQTQRLAEQLAQACVQASIDRMQDCRLPWMVTLSGNLGAGKTTFSQFFVRALCGQDTRVVSPTFSLLEPYECDTSQGKVDVLHMDLYRLADAEELEYLGVLDGLTRPAIWLVEWPSKGKNVLPPACIILNLKLNAEENSRLLSMSYAQNLKNTKGV